MNDDIRGTLSRALPDNLPAPRIELDALERRGEARVRRRRFGFAGLATAGVAVIAAAALTLPTAFAGTDGGDSTGAADDATAAQKAYPLPELDPAKTYMWVVGESTTNDQTKELTKGFWGEMSQRFPDLKVVDPESDVDKYTYLDPGEYPEMSRAENALSVVPEGTEYPSGTDVGDGEPTGYVKPVYGMPPEVGRFGATKVDVGDDAEFLDEIDVGVHPKGSYADGPEAIPGHPGSMPQVPHLSTGCKDEVGSAQGGTDNFGFEYDCDEITGPGGEKVHQIRLTVNGGKANPDFISYRVNTVIVTLDNGNAVVINDTVMASVDGHGSEAGHDRDDMKPAMDCDELTELALALPEVVIE